MILIQFALVLMVFCGTLDMKVKNVHHECVHDEIIEHFQKNGHSVVTNKEIKYEYNDLRSIEYENIRIHIDTSALGSEPSKKEFFTKIIDVSVDLLSKALLVKPVSSNIIVEGETCADYYEYPKEDTEVGVSDTDFIIYVGSETTSCTEDKTLAWALTCQVDGFNRPVVGFTNLCPLGMKVENNGNTFYENKYAGIVAHEIFHALGFSKLMFDCSHGCKFVDSETNLPLSKVVEEFSERGKTASKIVTPIAKKKAQEHFNCDSLNGVELEDQGGKMTSGSHLEMRLFPDEFMAGIAPNNMKFSPISFAIMEDSGWYKVDYSVLDDLIFGVNTGCEFAYLEKCLIPGDVNKPPTIPSYVPDYHYCTTGYDSVSVNYDDYSWKCTPDLKGKGFCGVDKKYPTVISSYFRYWGVEDTHTGGSPDTTDYCPYYRCITLQFEDSDLIYDLACNNPSGSITKLASWREVYGEIVGTENCHCFMSNLLQDGKETQFRNWNGEQRGVCFEVECEATGMKVWAKKEDGTRVSNVCRFSDANHEKTMLGFQNSFKCPSKGEMEMLCPNSDLTIDSHSGEKFGNAGLSGGEVFGVTFGVVGGLLFFAFLALFVICCLFLGVVFALVTVVGVIVGGYYGYKKNYSVKSKVEKEIKKDKVLSVPLTKENDE